MINLKYLSQICIITLFSSTISCNKIITNENVKVLPQQVNLAEQFEGYYFMPNGSQIELVANSDGEISTTNTAQSLNSINPQNNTLCTHPIIRAINLKIRSGFIFLSKNENYDSSTHDVENDLTGANITGLHRTDYLIESLDNGKSIRITITIFDNAINTNINSIVAVRVFEGN